jgi:glutamate-1-semialdehyde 2,1-aminomutase
MSDGAPTTANKAFCILPWMHLTVLPEGTVKLCCVASSCIKSGGADLSLQSDGLETIWNSQHLRAVRKAMLAGRRIADCTTCYLNEKSSGDSRRLQANARWAAELGPLFDTLLEQSRQQDYAAAGLPLYYQLMPGNLCNLKCRMCFPVFSSQIERDPVHRLWAPPMFANVPGQGAGLDWSRGRVTLVPVTPRGVALEGFHAVEASRRGRFAWTGAEATVTVAVPPGVRPRSVHLRVRRVRGTGQHLRVQINGTPVFDGRVPPRRWFWPGRVWDRTFALPADAKTDALTVQLQSSTIHTTGDLRELGVAVDLLELDHAGVPDSNQQPVAAGRLPEGPWYRDDAWVRDVLLQNADQLRGLYFTGGEPMVEKQVEQILDHLIARQVAGNIVIEANTNCTILREAMLRKLLQFKQVRLGPSIDAQGDVYEYIRYPAKWAAVRRNVEHLASLAGDRLTLHGGVVIMVYNVLNVVDVLEFFDGFNIPYSIEFASMPWFLDAAILPARVRAVGAARLRAYAAGRCRASQQALVLSVAQRLENMPDQCTPEALRTLMLFSNDLDATRRQNVRAVHGELLELLAAEGFSWTDERTHATAA